MKKMIIYILACLLILSVLSNCTQTAPTGTVINPTGIGASSVSNGSVSNDETIPDFEFPQKAPLPVAEREKTGSLIEYDPNREMYIMTGYNDCVYYLALGGDIAYHFYIFSKKPLDTECISVTLPIERAYSVSVEEKALGSIASYSVGNAACEKNQFPYELYQCYQGKNFRELAELKWDMEYWYALSASCNRWLDEEVITQEKADDILAKYNASAKVYENSWKAEMDSYYALKKEDLPKFHVYYISAVFDRTDKTLPDETFTEITVTIGDQVYQQQVGQITVKSGNLEIFDQRDWFLDIYNVDDGILGVGNYPLPYNDGVHTVHFYFNMEKVDRYKTLTRLVLDNPNQELLAVWIELITDGGKRSYCKWDMTEPFELYPGDQASIHITFKDKYMDNSYLGYYTKVNGYLEYESDGKTWCKISECALPSTMNYYMLYAIIFDGIDLESYYWDYYYLFEEPWRIDSDIGLYDSLPVIIEQAE